MSTRRVSRTARAQDPRGGARTPRDQGHRERAGRDVGRGDRAGREQAHCDRAHRDAGHRDRPRRDLGQAAIEYLGFLPLLLLVGLAGLQLGIAAYAAQQAGTAARAAARAESSDDEDAPDAGTAARAAVSGWIDPAVSPVLGDGEVTVAVTVRIPSVVPFWDDFGTVTKTATMPLPRTEEERP